MMKGVLSLNLVRKESCGYAVRASLKGIGVIEKEQSRTLRPLLPDTF
jgi:hypothetical protein